MDRQVEVPEPRAGTTHEQVTERRRVRRRTLPGWYWLAALVLPVALTALVGYARGPSLERAIRTEAKQALAQADLAQVRVVADGRRLSAKVPTGQDREAVEAVLASVPGVMSVTTTSVFASAAEAKACEDLQRRLDKATGDQRISFVGETTRLTATGTARLRAVGALLRDCRALTVTVGGHADDSTSDGSTLSLERARRMVALLRADGVDAEQLQARGYGDQFPVDDAGTAAAEAANQRGSIVVEGS